MDIRTIFWWTYVSCYFYITVTKGTVRFGTARVLIAQQGHDEGPDGHSGGGDPLHIVEDHGFNLRFLIPVMTEPEPSENFRKFASRAGKAFLVNSVSASTLYFAPEGYIYDEEWVAGPNICTANVLASQLRSDKWHFADLHQTLTVYYLCDYQCCNAQCCELNYSLLCVIGVGIHIMGTLAETSPALLLIQAVRRGGYTTAGNKGQETLPSDIDQGSGRDRVQGTDNLPQNIIETFKEHTSVLTDDSDEYYSMNADVYFHKRVH